MKPVTPDEKLAKVVGDKPLPRTELTKKLWAYIRKNGLQDAKKKTLINADENLKDKGCNSCQESQSNGDRKCCR